jgi:hypothetical protein
LLEEEQPAIRYRTLTDLLGRPGSNPEVRAARNLLGTVGWGASILAAQNSEGTWLSDEDYYLPKYLSTNWQLLVLADLGLTREDPRVARAATRWMERCATKDGGFEGNGGRVGHLCITGNTVRALIQFGYQDEPAVRAGLEWLVQHAAKLGGWSCFGSGRNLDSWEGLAAFAAYPRSRWTPEMRTVVASAAEFFLERELHRQGERYEPWYRFHYPVHYYYDLLVGLDLLTSLGYAGDPRLAYALDHLRSRRDRSGRWNLDAAHPDLEGGAAAWYEAHPKRRPTAVALETVGAPSKMVTLTARKVLARVAAAGTANHL